MFNYNNQCCCICPTVVKPKYKAKSLSIDEKRATVFAWRIDWCYRSIKVYKKYDISVYKEYLKNKVKSRKINNFKDYNHIYTCTDGKKFFNINDAIIWQYALERVTGVLPLHIQLSEEGPKPDTPEEPTPSTPTEPTEPEPEPTEPEPTEPTEPEPEPSEPEPEPSEPEPEPEVQCNTRGYGFSTCGMIDRRYMRQVSFLYYKIID